LDFFWRPRLLGSLEGQDGSTAERVIRFVEASKDKYPYLDKYFLLGPNSNTYVQWVLDKFPEFNIRLGRFFIGRNYKNNI
jgi:hypothetical protein